MSKPRTHLLLTTQINFEPPHPIKEELLWLYFWNSGPNNWSCTNYIHANPSSLRFGWEGAKPTDSKKLQGIQFTIWKALKITSAPRRGLDILFKDVHKKGIVTGRSYLGFSWGLGLARIIKGDGSNWGSSQFNDRLRQCMLSAILINHIKQWSK